MLKRSLQGLTLLAFSVSVLAQSTETIATRGNQAVTLQDIDNLLLGLSNAEKEQVVAAWPRVEQLIDSLLLTKQLKARVESQKLDADPEYQIRARMAAEKAIAEVVMKMLVERAAPKDVALFARETYLANKAQYVLPKKWHVRHLLVQAPKDSCEAQDVLKAKAAEFLARAQAGEDFEQLARQNSSDPSVASNGGLFEVTSEEKFAPEFKAAAMALKKVGDYAPLVKTEFGFHVMKLEKLDVERQLSFEEARSQIENELLQSGADRRRSEILSDLRAENPQYVQENLDKLPARYGTTVVDALIEAQEKKAAGSNQ